ncbi:hypothetical protein [Streptosporangium roseum]|uniref:hypothetical protein n=1 Tax=Streptosporangium roseum TaxID=2001 RepID=UPI0004CCE9A8|nr:hypothetical protein [Streptosporangium roseum]
MMVELTIKRITPEAPNNSPIDGVRILSLLPAQWRKELITANGEIVVRVHTDDGTTTAQIRVKVTAALTAPEVSQWRLATCAILAIGHPEPPAGSGPS